jgi:formyl-CoA transferase
MDLVKPDASSPPARSVAGMGDHPSAMALYGAIVTALYKRQITGKGGLVTSSLLANGLWSNGFLVQARLVGAVIPPRPPRHEVQTAMTNLYRTRDNRWFNLAMVNDVKQYPVLVEALGRPDLATDERFDTAEKRRANAVLMLAIFDEIFGAMDLADVRAKLDAAGITFGIIATLDEALDDEQMRAAEAIVPSADGTYEVINSPFHLVGETKVKPGPAPAVGEHSDEILSQAGYSAAEISRLRGSRVVM